MGGPRWLWIGVALLCAAVVALVPAVDLPALASTWRAAVADPTGVAVVLTMSCSAFMLRAVLFRRVLPSVSFGHSLAAIHVALAGNKLLPLRLGEALRVTSVVRRTGVSLAEATASTVVLRGADVLAVIAIAALLGPHVLAGSSGLLGVQVWIIALPACAAVLAAIWWVRRLSHLRMPALDVGVGAVVAWCLESGVMWQAARWAGIPLSPVEAVLVTALVTVAQVAALAPGGLGTYEAAAVGALVAGGAPAGAALAAALAAHAVNTAYALVAGAVAAVVPAPSLLGRWRLPRAAPCPRPAVDASGHVLLFLPAHDEEASVAHVVRHAPAAVCGLPVRCLVIDDGSTDRTAALAKHAGAEVMVVGENQGLGAAVRHGLAAGVAEGACVVAFCDADGEYAPSELERLVAPILAGDADYVVGSRFAGQIRRMPPHRRLGNLVLTSVLRYVARAPITDGQSGYRALSATAAAEAEILHDFNYAQVLTLDLLAKGFRYAEVPISYGFRETGRSFVRLGRYLRYVVPAVYAELNRCRIVQRNTQP